MSYAFFVPHTSHVYGVTVTLVLMVFGGEGGGIITSYKEDTL